jgi:hypothetical protein
MVENLFWLIRSDPNIIIIMNIISGLSFTGDLHIWPSGFCNVGILTLRNLSQESAWHSAFDIWHFWKYLWAETILKRIFVLGKFWHPSFGIFNRPIVFWPPAMYLHLTFNAEGLSVTWSLSLNQAIESPKSVQSPPPPPHTHLLIVKLIYFWTHYAVYYRLYPPPPPHTLTHRKAGILLNTLCCILYTPPPPHTHTPSV